MWNPGLARVATREAAAQPVVAIGSRYSVHPLDSVLRKGVGVYKLASTIWLKAARSAMGAIVESPESPESCRVGEKPESRVFANS